MRRNLLIILGTLVVVWGVLALALGSASLTLSSGSGSGEATAVSPQCLPGGQARSAALAGGVDVSPAPESGTANPGTQISFMGVPAARVRDLSVRGSRSGEHSGRMRAYSQGDGASFVPDRPFATGERVEVRATIGSGTPIAYGFRVDTPYSVAKTPAFGNPAAAPADYQSFYTLPGSQAPVMTVTTPDRDPGAGDVFTTNGPGPGQYGPLIYTPQGRLVWFQHLPGGETAEDLNVQTYKGRRVLTWWKGRVLVLGYGRGEDVVMDSRYRTIARVAAGNGLKADLHEFQLVPGDVAYITAYNPIHCDLRSLGGVAEGTIVDTAIQQIDIPTGLVRWEWHSLDHVAAKESEVETSEGKAPWDYFHLNSIDPEPDGDLLISARSTWAGYELQRGSGRVLWRLGGNASTFKLGPGTKMAWQHDARMLPNGELTFFDDGSNPPIHHQSRALRIRLDQKAREARLIKSYTHENPPLLAASQGNAQTLPGGQTLVGYGGVPAISEFSAAGALLFDAHQPWDMSFYRAFRYPWHATPAAAPAVLASLNDTGEETVVHASWNGATDLASWRVLAGKRRAVLKAQATIPVSGFESSTTLPLKYAYAAVQALDSRGRVLGTSNPVAVLSYKAALPKGAG